MKCLLPFLQSSVSKLHTTSIFNTPQVGCISTDTCLQWDKAVPNRLGSCHNGKYKLLCGLGGRLYFSSAWRAYIIFQSCRGCDSICLPNWFLCQVQCSMWEPGDGWDSFLSHFLLRGRCWLSLVSGWGVPSTAVSVVARRDWKDKWNGRAFQALIQPTVARWLWFPDWVSLFLWLPEGTMKMDDMAKCFIAFIQAPVSSLFWCKIPQYLRKRRKVPSVSNSCVLKKLWGQDFL